MLRKSLSVPNPTDQLCAMTHLFPCACAILRVKTALILYVRVRQYDFAFLSIAAGNASAICKEAHQAKRVQAS
jgi:hypothetical protein